jgi:hypothetical protein
MCVCVQVVMRPELRTGHADVDAHCDAESVVRRRCVSTRARLCRVMSDVCLQVSGVVADAVVQSGRLFVHTVELECMGR